MTMLKRPKIYTNCSEKKKAIILKFCRKILGTLDKILSPVTQCCTRFKTCCMSNNFYGNEGGVLRNPILDSAKNSDVSP